MNKKDIEKLVFLGLILTAIIVVILVTASILAPRERSGKAQKYDFDCTVEPKKNPIKECKK